MQSFDGRRAQRASGVRRNVVLRARARFERGIGPSLHICGCHHLTVVLKVILRDVDSLLYVDTDVLFLRPMDDIWSLFKSFNGTQLAAMAPEHEVPKIGWYSRFARHPFYGVTGVNSGVMLMNLTRIRSAAFKVRSKAPLQPPRRRPE